MPTFVLVMATAVFGLLLLLDLGMLLMSPMMFDAPGSEAAIYPWLIVGSLLLYPLLALVGLILAWIAYGRSDHRRAFVMLTLPLAGVAMVAGAFVLLELVCSGNFACK
ncbi:MAG: hypothetical protein IPO88_32675 [Nannocystis sp.]|uniref:hypothetical protein n=1 Tax=Nannocystis sp. TaxID=1962667 RepID=UPI00242A1486|nr:hypothetical protein [Nannocystis sp.]MBK9758189.1 hypothetical protein [Nannocystis sp.]